jgi:hypothetical protein
MSDLIEKVEKEEVEETGDDDNGPAPVRFVKNMCFLFILQLYFAGGRIHSHIYSSYGVKNCGSKDTRGR